MSQTQQQQRAQFALKQINALKNQSEAQQKNFTSYAKALPAMIRMNGFGQAMAFCCAKAGGIQPDIKRDDKQKAYFALYQLISNWLKRPEQPYKNQDVLEGLTNKDAQHYRLAQAETLALMSWVVKFAQAFLKAPETTTDLKGGG